MEKKKPVFDFDQEPAAVVTPGTVYAGMSVLAERDTGIYADWRNILTYVYMAMAYESPSALDTKSTKNA